MAALPLGPVGREIAERGLRLPACRATRCAAGPAGFSAAEHDGCCSPRGAALAAPAVRAAQRGEASGSERASPAGRAPSGCLVAQRAPRPMSCSLGCSACVLSAAGRLPHPANSPPEQGLAAFPQTFWQRGHSAAGCGASAPRTGASACGGCLPAPSFLPHPPCAELRPEPVGGAGWEQGASDAGLPPQAKFVAVACKRGFAVTSSSRTNPFFPQVQPCRVVAARENHPFPSGDKTCSLRDSTAAFPIPPTVTFPQRGQNGF